MILLVSILSSSDPIILSSIARITSFWFFVFAAAVFAVHYAAPRKARWRVLLLASACFFIAATGWKLYSLFIAQVFLAWGGALLARKFAARRSLITGSVVALELAALFVMKENSFFIENSIIISKIFGGNIVVPHLGWVAPLGMSYYTLMLVGYLLDAAWGTAEPRKNPLKLVLFAGFFPQMISGPIARYGEMSGQLYAGPRFDLVEIQFGLQRFMWGLFKKLVLAERLAVIVSTIYGGGTPAQMGTVTFEGLYIIIGAFAYVAQLYTDFSGCMDMALGLARMFGIKPPENFAAPFSSTSLSELWRRWHMTLGFWIKDYVMYPVQKSLATKFGGKAKRLFGKKGGQDVILYASMLVAWFSVGFWHGGSWKYICASGLFFFVMIVGGLILAPAFRALTKLLAINTGAWSWTLFRRARTVCLFTLSVSFGRADSLSGGFEMWGRAFKYNPWILVDGSLYKLGLDAPDFWVMVFGLMLLCVVSTVQRTGSVRAKIAAQNLAFRWLLWLGLFAAVLLFGLYGEGYKPADFIYGGF